jgi:tetratricopeptide (TPR) repeat protein
MQLLKPVLVTTAAVCLSLPLLSLVRRDATPATDYEVELARIDKDVSELKNDAFRTPVDVDRTTRFAYRLFQRAMLTGGAGDLAMADTAIERAFRAIGPTANLYLLKANLDFRLHRLEETHRDIAALSPFGDGAQVVALRAGVAFQEGRYDAARRGYLRAIEERPTWDNLARLAYWEAKLGDLERAGRLYEQAHAEIAPKDLRSRAWLRVQRGLQEFNRGRYDQALAHYEEADREYSGYWLVEEYMAELLGAQRKFDQAIALYRKSLTRSPRPELAQALGDLYVFMGRASEAEPWHDRALAAYLDSARRGEVRYYHHLARFYSDVRQDGAEALKWARRDADLRPHFVTQDGLAWALYRDGQFAAALAAMETALSSGVRDPHVFFHAGIISLAAGRTAEGKKFLKLLAELNPGYENFHAHR